MVLINLDIKESNKLVDNLRIISGIIWVIGIIVLTNNDNKPNYYFYPLVIPALYLLITKVYYPLHIIGEIRFETGHVEIEKNNHIEIIKYNELSKIGLNIEAEHMELGKDRIFPVREFFPFEHGHQNQIEFIYQNNKRIKTDFYLENKSQTRILTELIADLKLS